MIPILVRPKPRLTGRTIIQEHMFAVARRKGLPTVHRPRVMRAPILTPERLEALVAGVIILGSAGYVFGYHLVKALVTGAFRVYH